MTRVLIPPPPPSIALIIDTEPGLIAGLLSCLVPASGFGLPPSRCAARLAISAPVAGPAACVSHSMAGDLSGFGKHRLFCLCARLFVDDEPIDLRPVQVLELGFLVRNPTRQRKGIADHNCAWD